MTPRYLVVPQWQGSGSSRALQLVAGAQAIGGDLPAAATTELDVPLEAGDAEGTAIHRHSSIRIVRERLARELAEGDGPVVVIGGDCGVEYAAVAHAAADDDVALVWLDAHADANDPLSSPSGAFHGMVVRALVDDGVLPATRLVLAGTRAWDDAEREWADQQGVRRVGVAELSDPEALLAAVRETGARSAYLHVDLDVLDPAEFGAVDFPEPFGASVPVLVAAIRALLSELPLAGAGITEFSPSSPEAAEEGLPAILRVLAALTDARR